MNMHAKVHENKFNKWIPLCSDIFFRYLTLFLIICFPSVDLFANLYAGIDTRERLLGNIKWKSCSGREGISDVGFLNHTLVFTPHK